VIAVTLVEELGIGASLVFGVVVLAGVALAGWRGIKIIVVHRRNGADE